MEQSTLLALATIAAIIIGPIVALWCQRYSERQLGQRHRKLVVFKELMATRATRVSPRHVGALNAIEVEFSEGGRGDKLVLDAWRLYLDHLNASPQTMSESQFEVWQGTGNDLLTGLLYEMSRALQYNFDKLALKKNIYSPAAHGDLEMYESLVRKHVVEIITGKSSIPVDIKWKDETHGTTAPPPTALNP